VDNVRVLRCLRDKVRLANQFLVLVRLIVCVDVGFIHDVDIEYCCLHVSSSRAFQFSEQLSTETNGLVVGTNLDSFLVQIQQAYPSGARRCAFTTGILSVANVVLNERYAHRTILRVNRLHINRVRFV
jgi:hypothetical protein